MQKFSKSGCLVFLVACPLLIVWAHGYLPPEVGDERPWFAAAAGVLLAMGVSSLFLLLTGQVETREKATRRAEGGGSFADGDTVLVTGRARAAEPLLVAPISGTRCLAYFYRMYRVVNSPRRMPEERPVYWGYASLPLAVETPSRSVPVSAPQLALPRHARTGDASISRAREHVRAASWEPRGPQPFFAGDDALQWMMDIAPAADGSARRDWKSDEVDLDPALLDPAELRLEELVLTPGNDVAVNGRWSAERNTVVGDGGSSGAMPRLAPTDELGVGAGAPPSLLASWIGTVITFALAAAVIWFAVDVWPNVN
jgi:hypothetical protein